MNPKVAVADDFEDSRDDDEEAGVRGEEQNNKTTIWGVSAHQKQHFTNVIIYCLYYDTNLSLSFEHAFVLLA